MHWLVQSNAVKQAEAGVDILIVSGTEAGGHCGEVSTMVWYPRLRAVAEFDGVSILAAGGIVTGRQMAAAMAMGAHGAWCSSVWLTTQKRRLRRSSKRNCSLPVQIKPFGRKAALASIRQIRSPGPMRGNQAMPPDPLPMPLQSLVSEPALSKVAKLAETGHQVQDNWRLIGWVKALE